MKSMWNLYRFEIKSNRRSLLIWIVSISLVMLLFMSIFPSMGNHQMNDLIYGKLELIPDALKAMVGLDKFLDFSKVMPFFGYCFQFILVALIIYAVSLGAKMVAKEQDLKTIDYLVTKPIKREHLLFAKYDAGVDLLLLMILGLFVTNFFIILLFNQWQIDFIWHFVFIFVSVFFVLLLFYSISFFLSVIVQNGFKAMMAGVSCFFLSYILGTIAALESHMKFLRFLSPYHLIDVTGQTSKLTLPYIEILSFLSLSIILLLCSIYFYKKKDLVV